MKNIEKKAKDNLYTKMANYYKGSTKELFDTNTTDEFGATQYIKIPKKKTELEKLEILEGEQANRDIDDKLLEEAMEIEDLKYENEYHDMLSGLQDAKDAIGDEYR